MTQFNKNYKNYLKIKGCLFKKSRDYSKDFIENSTAHREKIKQYILNNKLIEYKCNNCPNIGYHNEQPLILHLEHKNGVNNDNRLENLCFLCPNCHSQTATYCGRNARKKIKSSQHKLRDREKYRKFNPTFDELKDLVWKMPVTSVAEIFNVSDSAIKRRCKLLNIDTPPRGYWSIKKSEK
jgi:5-methylcytosine-specific restriction endonuclease McrA